jgi:hypothetical protein
MLKPIDKGCDRAIRVVVWESGAQASLTGATPTATLRPATRDVVLTWGAGEGELPIAISADGYAVELAVTPANTATLTPGRFVLEVFVTISGKKYRVLTSEVYLRQ